MKVQFRKNIRSYSGENEELVYQAFNRGWVCIGRDFVYPTLTANNHEKGAITTNLASVFRTANVTYRNDLAAYAQDNKAENLTKYDIAPRTFALFLKLMYAWYESDPTHVDLKNVTVADIVALDADVRTISRAVEAEFLPHITDASSYTNDIQ